MPDELIVSDQWTLNGVQVRTVHRGGRYVTEVWFQDAMLNRAENTDRFFAGVAHGSFLLSWAAANADNLLQAVFEAREEGYGR